MESENERNERNESTDKEKHFSGDSVPSPLGFIALMPIPVNKSCWGSAFTEPQPGLGPGVDAQVASQQSLSFTPAVCSVSVLVVLCNREMKKGLIIAALSDMLDNASG
jgi:hypothetical protein